MYFVNVGQVDRPCSGYSWKANQHGLAVDTVVAFELVKPDGSTTTVTEESDAELFFGLKVMISSHLISNPSSPHAITKGKS